MSRTTIRRLHKMPKNPGRHEAAAARPNRVLRAEELALINLLGGSVALEWFLLAAMDSGRAISEFLVDVGAPSNPRWNQKAFEASVTDLLAETNSEPATSMLFAATRWFTLLDLPGNGTELWAGPPLKLRRRDRHVVVELRAAEWKAVRAFASDCLDGPLAEALKAHALGSDDLQQVLDILDAAGGGRVDLEIVRISDARRIFSRMRTSASRSGSEDWRIVVEACTRIVGMIDADRNLFVGVVGKR